MASPKRKKALPKSSACTLSAKSIDPIVYEYKSSIWASYYTCHEILYIVESYATAVGYPTDERISVANNPTTRNWEYKASGKSTNYVERKGAAATTLL